MTSATSTQVFLAARPDGWPTDGTFRIEHVDLPELADGEIRVANEFVSVDPYMRGRMIDRPSYAAPYRVDEVMTGGAVGRVIASRSETVPEGALVSSEWGWRDIAQGDAARVRVLPEPGDLSPSVYLGVLGMTALTAYVGLTAIGHLAAGETVFVSGAAGAVGSQVGQIARQLGAGRVIGSAGSAAKVERLTGRYGFDAAFDYHDGAVRTQLAAAAPDGIDVYFDNVGGEHLEAAIGALNRFGRGVLCGAISGYNDSSAPAGPRNMSNIITQSLTLRGFTVGEHFDALSEFTERMRRWIADGAIQWDEWIVDGIENAPQAFIDMMRGANTGKALVRI